MFSGKSLIFFTNVVSSFLWLLGIKLIKVSNSILNLLSSSIKGLNPPVIFLDFFKLFKGILGNSNVKLFFYYYYQDVYIKFLILLFF